MNNVNIECIECDANIEFNRSPLCGEVVVCSECSVELEVVRVSPITLELAPDVEEDWGE